MELHENPDTDSLDIDLNGISGTDAREIVDRMIVDFDAERRPVGIDI